MDPLTVNSKWTSPRAAHWVPIVSTHSSPESSPHSASLYETPRKRPRPQVDSPVVAANGASATRFTQSVDVFDQLLAQPERKKPYLSNTEEVRALRAEVIAMESTLAALTSKWRATAMPSNVLLSACESAREKSRTIKSQQLNSELKNELLLQQLYFAALQSGITESPLLEYPTSHNVFDAIHTDVHLPVSNDATRIAMLCETLESAARIAPAMAQRLTRNHVSRASLSLPYMGSSITSDERFTYVSTLFVAKIQHASVTQVFGGVLGFFRQLKTQVQHHFGIQYDTQTIHSVSPSSEYGLVRYVKEGMFATGWNATLMSTLTSDCGSVVCDFVESDELYPIERRDDRFRKEVSAIFTVSPAVDEATGVPCVVIRQVRVARYNLMPNSRLLHEEIQVDKGFSNGDLLMAIVCRHLRELQSSAAAERQ